MHPRPVSSSPRRSRTGRPASLIRSGLPPAAVAAALLASAVIAPAQNAPAPSASANANAAAASEEAVQLPAFLASDQKANEYRATDSFSASRIRGSIMDAPASISVLTPEFIADIAPVRLYEATRYLAGVSEGRANSFSDRQIIRGFENNGRTIDNFNGIQQNNTDNFLVDRVEVIKGPSAILAPTGTPGGSINVVSKMPKYTTQRTLTAEVGLSDAQRVDLDMTGPFSPGSPFAYRVLATYQDGVLNREGGQDQRKNYAGQISYRISEKSQLTVRASYEDRRIYAPFPVYVSSASLNGGDAELAPGFSWHGSRNGQETWAHRGGPYGTSDILSPRLSTITSACASRPRASTTSRMTSSRSARWPR